MSIKRGKYIVLEGADGSGKTTALERIKEQYALRGKQLVIVNILKDQPASMSVRNIVTNPDMQLHPDAEACLYAGAVLNTYHLVIKPLLEQGIDVISDRSFISTLAYQGSMGVLNGNPGPLKILKQAYSGDNGIVPDYIILLYADPNKGLERVFARDGKLDRIEARGVRYQEQVQDAYVDVIETYCRKATAYVYANDTTLEVLYNFVDRTVERILTNT